ncbi:MAG: acetate--CoA ligase [Methanomassiliicoccales archaeon]|jgi:acetyl-CoA synthetase
MEEKMLIQYPPHLRWMLKRALDDPEGFWGEIASELHWFKPWDKVFEQTNDTFKWFSGGLTNLSYNCVDYHVKKGRGNRAAIIWESGEGGQTRVLTYNQLLFEVTRFAKALRALGVKRGDRVTIYMPMIPEAVVAMLATTRIGAIHSVVFGGFGYGALAERIADAKSEIVVTSDVGYRRGKVVPLKETVDLALKEAKGVKKVVVLKRGDTDPPMTPDRDILWEDAVEMGASESPAVVPMRSDELAFILYTSGTMAKPKGTVQPHGSYQVYVYAMGKWVYDLKETDVWWSTSDIGWIVGHSYVVYGPLLTGCTTVMYEGVPDYPTPDIWWKIAEKNRVTQMWISPTGVRALMQHGEQWPKKHDLSSIRAVFCAGEVLNPPAYEWLSKKVFDERIPVVDHMWQTETSGPIIGNPIGIATLPILPGSATIALPGIDADVVDDRGQPLPPGVEGNFVIRRPFPGLTPTIWNDPERYKRDYWSRIPGCYYTGDGASRDENGYFWFVGRFDEIIKISAHRVGTVEIESVLLIHPDVAEAAVVGVPDELRGEVAFALVVPKPGREPTESMKAELKELVRKNMGAVVVIGNIAFVSKLPKTRSGKIMRRLIKALVSGQPLGDTSTIEDPAAIEEIKKAVQMAQTRDR